MLRIKYRHPFCGNPYASFFLIVEFIVAMLIPLPEFFPEIHPLLKGAVGAVILGGVTSVIMHIPNAGDMDCMRQSAEPVWLPAPESLREKIRKTEQDDRFSLPVMLVIFVILCVLPFLIMLVPGTKSHAPLIDKTSAMYISLAIGAVSILVILVYQIRSRLWEHIDETAVCATVPVHHFYHEEDADKHKTCYLVFYTPHGKYVLESPSRTAAEYVIIIKYRFLLRWIVMPEKEPPVQKNLQENT